MKDNSNTKKITYRIIFGFEIFKIYNFRSYISRCSTSNK